MLKLSILDYTPVHEQSTHRDALLATTRLARKADELGFNRFWVSEHHGMVTMAGSNPEMLMMHLAANTKKIRIGSGGVMLPHYSPYKVVEGFKLMEALYPDRIDLGTGRAPGGDRIATAALIAGKIQLMPYEQQLIDLKAYLTNTHVRKATFPGLMVTPLTDTLPEMWSLSAGSGGASLAAEEGTSFIFAHFINPTGTGVKAVGEYLANFIPSALTTQPQTMVAVFVAVAETDEAAELLAKAFDHWLLMIESGRETPFYLSPETIANYEYSPQDLQAIRHNRRRIIVGNPNKVKIQIEALAEQYHTNEVMLLPHIYGADNRMASLELLADAFNLIPDQFQFFNKTEADHTHTVLNG